VKWRIGNEAPIKLYVGSNHHRSSPEVWHSLRRASHLNSRWAWRKYESVSKSFRTEPITKYTLTTINTRWEATQRVMAAELTRLAYIIAIQLHLVAESCTICSSRSGRSVRKLLDTPSYIIRVIEWRRARWVGNVARMVRWEMHTKLWLENLKGRNHSEDLDVDGGIILESVLGKWDRKVWIGCICHMTGISGGLLWKW
jgi:hypothetical protein